MEMHLHNPRTVGRLSSRKSSLRRSISSGSSEIGGSCNSVSFSFSLPGGVGLQENVLVGKSMQKKGFMNWFSSKNQGDVEDGQLKHRKNVSVLRLASLNKPETPVFILESIAAVAHGVTFPIFSLLLPSAIAGFYELPHKLRKDAKFWALTYILQATCLLMGQTQSYCFAVAGVRLARPIRSLTFNKIVLYSPWLDIKYIIFGVIIQTPNLCNRCKIINRCCDSAQYKWGMVCHLLLRILSVENISTITAAIVIAFSEN